MELKNLAAAKIKAMMALEPLRKDATNPHFKQKYSSLAAVLDVVQPAYSNAGIAIFEGVTSVDGAITVEVTLCHAESGESVTHQLPMPVVGNNAQAVGSAITYGRRYLLMTMCGVAPEDDDGESASKPPTRIAVNPVTPVRQQAPPPALQEWESIPGVDEPEPAPEPDPETLRRRFHALGTEVYGPDWDAKRHELVKAFGLDSSKSLSEAQTRRLIAGMEAKQATMNGGNGTH